MAIDNPPSGPLGMSGAGTDDELETIPNQERGCGHLEEKKTYLRSDVSRDGELPAFVELDEPIGWYEGHFRNWKPFPGIQFEIAATGGDANGTNPPGEVWNMLDRLKDAGTRGEHVGEMRTAHAHDILDWVGASYYDTPGEFIDEAREQGVNRAIGASTNQPPPVVNPGFTRIWFVHPNAVEVRSEDDELADEVGRDTHRPGVIGYTYLTRVIHTAQTDDAGTITFPGWAQELAAAGKLDLVQVGEPVPADAEPDADGDTTIDEWASSDPDAEGMVPVDEIGFHDLRGIVSREDLNPGRTPSTDDLRAALHDAGIAAVRESEVGAASDGGTTGADAE